MTTDYQAKEAKIKELIAKATSPRDKAFYQGLLNKAIASRPKQIVSVVESTPQKSKSQSASVTDKKKKTSSSTTKPEQSQSHEQKQKSSPASNQNGLTSLKQKSEQDIQDNGLAKKANSDDKSLLATTSKKQESSQPSSSQSQFSTQLKEELPPDSTNPEPTDSTNPEPTDSTNQKETDNTETEGAVQLKSRYLFQAIGLIRGQVISTTKKLKIEIDGRRFELKPAAPSHKKKLFQKLRTEILATGARDKTLLVYPQIQEVANQPNSHQLCFKLVDTKNLHYWQELEPGEFILSGIWEYIPNTEQTSITIRRNSTPGLIKCLKKLHKTVKKTMTKPLYLPCEWSEPTVKPFQYREDVPKKELKRYFVQTHARLSPETRSFQVIKQLAKPTRGIPTYIK
ncbi:MAG: hypothetical protein AB4368_08675 [Xenococcaceae cyanobacterium]